MGIDENGALREAAPSTRQNFQDRGNRPQQTQYRRTESAPVSVNRGMPPKVFSKAPAPSMGSRPTTPAPSHTGISADEKKIFKSTLEDLFGTRGACIFDQNLTILGKVPLTELNSTIKSLNGGIYALALDGSVDIDLLRLCEKLGVTYLVATSSKVKEPSKVNIVTDEQLVA